MKIYLIRHAETTHNVIGRYYADEHVAFTKRGEKQLLALDDFFKDISLSKVFTSPKKRCMVTAANLHCGFVESFNDFRDIEQGVYGGLTKDEVNEKYPGLEDKRIADMYNFVYPDGESHKECEKRVLFALHYVLDKTKDDFAIVTHAAPILLILKNILNISFADARKIFVYPGSVTTLDFSNGDLSVLEKPSDLIGGDYTDLKKTITKMDSL